MNIKGYFIEVVGSVQRSDKAFAEVLHKWSRFICSSVSQVATVTQDSEEDILQDFFLELHKANINYKTVYYRYKGHLYEMDYRDGSLVHLRSNRFNTRFKHTIWVSINDIEQVKKSSLSSFIYHKVSQYKVDRINACYRVRNGYTVTGYTDKIIRIHEGDHKKLVKKKIRKMTKAQVLSMEDIICAGDNNITIGDTLASLGPSPSEQYEERRMLEESRGLSKVTEAALQYLLLEPSIRENTLSSDLGCSRRKTRAAKGEIMRRFLNTGEVVAGERCYFDGVEFSKLGERGAQILLGLPSGKTLWADKADVILKPSGVKPVQLKVSEVR